MFDTSASGSGELHRTSGVPAASAPLSAPPVIADSEVADLTVAGSAVVDSMVTDSKVADSAAVADSSTVANFALLLAHLDEDVSDVELIDRITALEKLKSAAAAAQARATTAYDISQRRAQSEAGVRAEKIGEGISGQIGRARQDSPHAGGRHVGAANALVKEMPHTLAALTTGVLSEWRATILVKETACLDLEDRIRVDEALAADPQALEGIGNKRLTAMAKAEAYRCDPQSVVRRNAKAESERTVTCRPAPDTMTYLTGLLPVAQGVAVQTALQRAADHLRSYGDGRGRGQIMADTLVDRVTRPEHGPDGKPGNTGGAGIEIQLIMTDRALIAGDQEPAYLQGYGTVPAGWARELLREAPAPGPTEASDAAQDTGGATGIGSGRDWLGTASRSTGTGRTSTAGASDVDANGDAGQKVAESRVWVRRLYTAPGTGQLIGMDAKGRIFPKALRKLIIARDQTCRTPWCDAPIRHIDHIRAHGAGGKTTEANGEGLCERCNQAKEAPGYESRPVPGNRHTVETVTPTGHTYRTTAPSLPGTSPQRNRKTGDGDWTLRSGRPKAGSARYARDPDESSAMTGNRSNTGSRRRIVGKDATLTAYDALHTVEGG